MLSDDVDTRNTILRDYIMGNVPPWSCCLRDADNELLFEPYESPMIAKTDSDRLPKCCNMRIFLAGVSCVGKTTIGAELAAFLACPFFDLDIEIERFFNTPIECLRQSCLTAHEFSLAAAQALKHVLARGRQPRLCYRPAAERSDGRALEVREQPIALDVLDYLLSCVDNTSTLLVQCTIPHSVEARHASPLSRRRSFVRSRVCNASWPQPTCG